MDSYCGSVCLSIQFYEEIRLSSLLFSKFCEYSRGERLKWIKEVTRKHFPLRHIKYITKENNVKCWNCKDDIDYPFWVEGHGRAYCTETCFVAKKGLPNASACGQPHLRQPPQSEGTLSGGVPGQVQSADNRPSVVG